MGSRLAIKVVPGASREGIAGWIGERLKVRVAAPPERGKANAAAERVVAAALGLAPERVRIVSGGSSAQKLLAIDDLSEAEVAQRLAAAETRGSAKRPRRC